MLFCDLVGFTPLSEQLDPEDVREIQGVYFGRMSQEIRRFGGSIEKYAGDAVLALFGVPVAHEDDAARAVRCGLSMQAVIKEVAAGVGKRWGVELALRVGVNTGEVVSGIWDIGDRQDYAVSGDAVNSAARLQAVAEPGEVLVGEETMWLARRTIRFGERRAVVLKGKAGVVPVYSAIEERQRPSGWGERGQPIPLVGRNQELTFLSGIWTKVVQEVHPHLVTVLGEPGIGKSRLVAAFEGNLVNQARILHGRCLPYGEVRGYWALAEVVREAAGITLADDMQMASRKLSELVAGVLSQTEAAGDPRELTGHLARLCGLDVDGERPATLADQRTLHTSVCRFIEALARSQPLCLVFEDLHWADEALLDLIEFITAHVREAPLLVMTQARPELLEQRPAWGRGLRNCTSLALEPLDERHGRDFALLLCQEHGLAAGAAEQVVRGAAGNPLFAEELVATIAERGGTAGIPAAIKALIAARLDRLPPQERRALQLAAVIGKVFWEGGLRALGAAGEVTEHLEALKQKELLRTHPRSQMHDDRQYAFKHDLIRDVAYERLSRADRRLLHRRLVGWIELISGERVGEYLDLLAHHAFQAGAWEQALAYAQRAGEQAQRLYAPRAAIEQFTRALEATHHLALAPLPALYHARGQAYETLGSFEQARHDYEQALEAAHKAHDGVAEWQSLLDLGSLWAERDYQHTGAYFRRTIERARALADPKLLAHSLNRLGNWHANVEQPLGALRCHQEALAIFQQVQDQHGVAETLDLLGMVGSLSGDPVQSASYYRASRRTLPRDGQPGRAGFQPGDAAVVWRHVFQRDAGHGCDKCDRSEACGRESAHARARDRPALRGSLHLQLHGTLPGYTRRVRPRPGAGTRRPPHCRGDRTSPVDDRHTLGAGRAVFRPARTADGTPAPRTSAATFAGDWFTVLDLPLISAPGLGVYWTQGSHAGRIASHCYARFGCPSPNTGAAVDLVWACATRPGPGETGPYARHRRAVARVRCACCRCAEHSSPGAPAWEGARPAESASGGRDGTASRTHGSVDARPTTAVVARCHRPREPVSGGAA